MRRLLFALALWLVALPAHATITCNLPFNLQNNTTADATQVMANYNALVTCFTSAASAGANTDITSLGGLTTPIPASGGGSTYYWGTGAGSANAQTVGSVLPTGYTLTAGRAAAFVAAATNTGATTFAINSTAATAVRKITPAGLAALQGGEIVAGTTVFTVFDGTFHVIIPNAFLQDGFSNCTSITSNTTTNLATATGHCASITGTTTITSFGNTGIVAGLPYYLIKFTGALTLTHNGTSLILPGAANITTAANDTAIALYLGTSTNWQVVQYTRASGLGVNRPAPDVQIFTSGTAATYTTATNNGTLPTYLHVRMVGGGGGGGGAGAGSGAGGNGTTTSFASWTAVLGNGGAAAGGTQIGGSGGTGGTDSTGTRIARIDGADGGSFGFPGGVSFFGGGGRAQNNGTAVGGTAKVNSGSGGGAGVSAGTAGGSGGAGEYVEFIITSPAASYTYTVGALGAAGAGATAGGAGAAGRIEVIGYWQ